MLSAACGRVNVSRWIHRTGENEQGAASGTAESRAGPLAFVIHEPLNFPGEAPRLPQHDREHDQPEDMDREASDGDPEVCTIPDSDGGPNPRRFTFSLDSFAS